MTAITMDYQTIGVPPPPGRHPLARALIGMLALVGAGAALWGFLRVTGDQPVARIAIEGALERVKVSDIESAVRPLVATDFAAVDLDVIQQKVEALPWVKRVRVERIWPASVRLRVWERVATARWDDHELLDRDAEVFAPAGREVSDSLPRLSGPEGSSQLVMEVYRQLESRLATSDFALAGLAQDARGDWTGVTRSGIHLRFGRGNPVDDTQTLLGPVARALSERMNEVEHIDLRYTNGFSVGWRKPDTATKRK